MCEPLYRQRLPHFAHRLTSLELLDNGMGETFPVLLDTLFLDCCELSAPILMIEHVAAGTLGSQFDSRFMLFMSPPQVM